MKWSGRRWGILVRFVCASEYCHSNAFANYPVKSLAEQADIVAILDKVDSLTNSITKGLPCEIKLRQQQYEYYRDLLLSFPEPETTSSGRGMI